MTTNEKYEKNELSYCTRIVPPIGTICIICSEAKATAYCRGCKGAMCAYCRNFTLHNTEECDLVPWNDYMEEV